MRKFFLLFTLVTIILFSIVYERVYFTELNYRVENLKKEAKELFSDVNCLKAKRDSLSSYSRIKKKVETELNMRLPKPEEVTYKK